ncbi:5-oxoprolinase subunit PxpB [Alicyclobacillus sacchari]|uniref:5-oxoprolinase subunit PxpB n=1 Tax=Alicyclobacillus sacchari TaxID=392010 RepID=UPI001FBA5A65|nr:5-oxoprolinase subunit PxpB [Alicyclobacillus sacchari]
MIRTWDVRCAWMGDTALLLRLQDAMPSGMVRAMPVLLAIDSALRNRLAGVPGVRDCVLAYRSLAIYFDPDVIAPDELRARVDAALHDVDADCANEQGSAAIAIPVCYGGPFGPDLEEVARLLKLAPEEVVCLHTAGSYEVAMIGFAPGFPYLTGLHARIAVPRKTTPRARVAAGSVGIAGAQTGIYPFATPGGWQIIGRTPLPLFDPERRPPALLEPGMRVTFRAIDEEEYDGIRRAYT